MSRPARLLWHLLLLCLLPACGPREIEPAVLRYFSASVVAAHDAYILPKRYFGLLSMAIYFAFIGLFLGFKLNRRLKLGCEAVAARMGHRLAAVGLLARLGAVMTRMWRDETWGGALLFAAAYVGILFVIGLPGTFYFDWYFPREHGTSVTSLGRFVWDGVKALGIEVVMLSMLTFGIYGAARWLRRWWLIVGIVSGIGIFVAGGVLDPINEQLYHKHERFPDGPTKEKITEVLKKAHVEYEDIFLQKMSDVTRYTNAYIAGEGPTRRIVVWDTFAAAMTPEEVANGVAHEVGHLNDHAPGRLVFASLLALPLLYGLVRALRRLGRKGRFGFDDDRDVASLPMVFLLYLFFGMITDPLSSAYSRHLEARADRYGLELLEQPAVFRSMLVKLARTNLADVHPPAWVAVRLSHPPVMERIEATEAFARERGIELPAPTPGAFAIPEQSDPLKAAKR
jgi:STE24 endopeptidase